MSNTIPVVKAGARLKDELALNCLPSTTRDPNRKVAWVNSIGILFLAVGIMGARRATVSITAPPPMVQPMVAIAEPPPPVTKIEVTKQEDSSKVTEAPAPQVVIVVPDSPAIEFSIPTIGTLIAPASLGQAPTGDAPVAVAAVQGAPASIQSTGSGGDRPQPPYPQMARELAQQGTVVLVMTADANGLVSDVAVKQSSGSPVLDRSSLEFVKRHWILPSGSAGRKFEAAIRYILEQ